MSAGVGFAMDMAALPALGPVVAESAHALLISGARQQRRYCARRRAG